MVIAYKNKLGSLIILRGIAALLVCFCHFAKPLSVGYSYAGIFYFINAYGKYGVEMFFVISGFVIPLSFDNGEYRIRDYFTFLYKRLIRLHPAYIATILLTLIITYLSFKQKQLPFPETFESVFNSLFYFENLGLNVVFWTLRIEAEYYLFIGLFFILLKKHRTLALFIVIPLLLLASQYSTFDSIELLRHLVFFLIGTIGYLIYSKQGDRFHNYFYLIGLIIFSFIYTSIPGILDSVPAAIAGLFTIIFILKYKGKSYILFDFFGKISYSLYLVHYPIAKQLIRLMMRFLPASIAWVLFLVPFIIILPIAWLFYKYIEHPSEQISKKINYSQAKISQQAV
ncbi:MAG: acyltransferase [bacterium]|nr:acyltransferase [bacterium]